jgi:hypothetical protein
VVVDHLKVLLLTDLFLPKVQTAVWFGHFTPPFQKPPELVLLMVNTDETQCLDLVLEHIVDPKAHVSASLGSSRQYLEFYLDVVSSVPSSYHNDFLIE